jgi:DNA (cytosine-5)-methyltransferase 1
VTRWAYYNDNDPFVCEWARELIKAGLVPDGEVDERPIQEVQPNEIRDFVQCHFFSGILGWPYALGLAGWPADRPVWTGSCPCQPFSVAGKCRRHADNRHLWPAWARLLAECRPPIVFGEQVASRAGRLWLAAVRADLEGMGYAVGAADLCAAGVGAPHIRQRLWFVADANTGDDKRRQSDGPRIHESEIGKGTDDHTSGRGSTSLLADAERDTRGTGRTAIESRESDGAASAGPHAESGRRGDPRGLADPLPAGRPEGRAGTGNGPAASDGKSGELGYPESERRGEARDSGGRPRQRVGDAGAADGLGHAEGDGCEGQPLRANREPQDGITEAGISSFWSSCDWLPCRDGKARPIPTESALFPLATGIPNRMGLLRGSGNAINPYTAAAFVKACMTLGIGDAAQVEGA